MSAFPAEIYVAVADFMPDIRPILLSSWANYRGLYDRADAEFWRIRDGIKKAKIMPEKMYHLVKVPPYEIIVSGNVKLAKAHLSPQELQEYPISSIQSGSAEMFNLVFASVKIDNNICNFVSSCCMHDNLYAMRALAYYTNVNYIVNKAAKYGAVSILQKYAPKYAGCLLVPMRIAVDKNRLDALKELHSVGGNICDRSLLLNAIYHGHNEIAEYLAENGARDDFIWGLVAKYS